MSRIIFVSVLAAALLTGCGESQARSLDGSWKSSDGTFLAQVQNNRITINLHVEDTTGLYWRGTFTGKGREIKSYANRKALENAIFGSEDRTKTFVVKPHEIRFHFSINDVDKVVSLRRSH
jgi:hypothetical protein